MVDVEDVVDQAHDSVGVLDGDRDHAPGLLGRRAQSPALQKAERAADGGQRRAQLVADDRDQLVLDALDLTALTDVLEDHHGAGDPALLQERRAGVFDGEGRAVPAPEDVAIAAVDLAVAQRRQDRAVLPGVWGPVGPGVLQHGVQISPPHIVDAVSREAQRRAVGERHRPADVEAADSIPGGVQQRLVVTAGQVQSLPGTYGLGDVLHRSDEPHDGAGVVDDGPRPRLGDPLDTVRTDHPVREHHGRWVLQRVLGKRLYLRPVCGVDEREVGLERRCEGRGVDADYAVHARRPQHVVGGRVPLPTAQPGDLLCFGQLRLAAAQPLERQLDGGIRRAVRGRRAAPQQRLGVLAV